MADTIALRHRNEITDHFAMEFQKSKSPRFASRKFAQTFMQLTCRKISGRYYFAT